MSQVDRRDHWWRWFYDLELLENTVCELDEMIQMLTTVLNWHEHAKERNSISVWSLHKGIVMVSEHLKYNARVKLTTFMIIFLGAF